MVSLSWGYDNDHRQFAGILANGVMHEDLVRAIELTQDSVFWLLRLHPVQLRLERYNHHRVFLEELTSQTRNCEWHQASTLPLPLLLSQCHGHITMSSMTTYEAAFLAVPSLLLCPTLRSGAMKASMFGDLRLSGYAELGEFDAQKIKAMFLQRQAIIHFHRHRFTTNDRHPLRIGRAHNCSDLIGLSGGSNPEPEILFRIHR